jgi:hypothetical protein
VLYYQSLIACDLWSLKMNGNAARFFRLGVGFVGLLALGCVLTVSAAKPSRRGIALPTDWSHSHLIFSQPRSVEQAMRLQEDPRFGQQLYRRALPLLLPPDQKEMGGIPAPQQPHLRFPVRLPPRVRSTGLWSQSLGAGAGVGAVNFPAKFSFNSGVADCGSDYVVYSTGLVGSMTQASLIAYNNLYSGCGGMLPSVYWAYDTGGQILTSPVLSLDGTQIAFAQTSPGAGSLVLLKWAASPGATVASPGVLTPVSSAAYSTCTTLPCMTMIALQDPPLADDTLSSVYYDYGSDTAWVGDSNGYLHRFHPVFAGPPAEVGGSWPVELHPPDDAPLASPVYDSGSGNVFVGDRGGYFYSVSAATGMVTRSKQLDVGTGIRSGPLVDSTAGVAYVFSSNDGSTACSSGPCAAVYSFAAGFAAGSPGTEVAVGASATTPNPLYEGELDSAYENSTDASGNLYVCGNTGGKPTLYQVHITSGGVLGPAVPGPVLTAATTTGCSPVTDFLNPNATGGATEFIFASAQTDGLSAPCGGGGCIMNFKSTPWLATNAYTLGQEIVDSNFQVQMVITAGMSGTSAPAWSTSIAAPPADETTDGTVKWVNLGVTTAATPASWIANNPYAVGNFIEDTNFNIQVVTRVFGNDRSTNGAHPTWSTEVGQTTVDRRVIWTNAGPPTGALATAGGTSGVIIDNIVESGVSGSQIYFSTQGNQTCGTVLSVGCAVQASQSALQ